MESRGALVWALVFALLGSTILLTSPSSQAQEAEVVVRGKPTAYQKDHGGTDPPWEVYEAGDMPPVVAAQRIGKGAVVAAGFVASCRDGRWNGLGPYSLLDRFMVAIFRWMNPRAKLVLWYEGREVYNNTGRCGQLIRAIEERGYTVVGDSRPITQDLLAPFDIVVIPQLQLGAPGTGGDPGLLPDSEVRAMVDFVRGGGGLVVMETSDFYAYQYYKVQNKILEALGFRFRFQNDQVNEFKEMIGNLEFQPLVDVDPATGIGEIFKELTGKTELGLYSVCSLAEAPSYYIKLEVSPASMSGQPGEEVESTLRVMNMGELDDVVALSAKSTAGWEVTLSPEVEVGSKETKAVALRVKIPQDASPGDFTLIKITGSSRGNPRVKHSVRSGAEVPREPELGRWTVVSRLFPFSPGYGVTVAGAGDSIYVTNTTQFFRFNLKSYRWEELPVPGMFANGASLVWDGKNYIYALLGASYSSAREAATYHVLGEEREPMPGTYAFFRFNISERRWEELADTPWFQGPGCALAWARGYVYALLGTSAHGANPEGWFYFPEGVQFWRFNPRENRWDKRLADIPYGADDGANLVWAGGDYLYALPGSYAEDLPAEDERHFLRYHIPTDAWEELAPTPLGKRGGVDDGGSMVWPGGENLYVLKGGDLGGSEPASDFWCYIIPENRWVVLEPAPAGVADNNGRRLGVANGSVYFWRGCFGDGTLWVYGLKPVPKPVGRPWATLAVGAAVLVAVAGGTLAIFKRGRG